MTLSSHPALSKADVIHLVGEIDDATIAAILASGAGYIDVEHAVRAITGSAADRRERGSLTIAATAVYDILAAHPAFAPDEER